MSKINSDDNNKNSTSPYDEFLRQLKEHHKLVAKESLQRLYELLKIEDPLLSKDDMYDRIMKDTIEIWQKKTIQNNMPDELKDPERQESGRKAQEKKKELTVTTNGSVAPDEGHYSNPVSQTESKSGISPIETLAAVKANAEPNKQKFVPIDPRIEELELENGRLKEQLKEQHDQIQELIKSVNASVEIKQQQSKQPIQAKETLEYKALLSEKAILQDRIDELEALVKKDPKLGFQSATTMQRESNDNATAMQPISNDITTITTTIPNEIEFPARDLSTMFLDSRNAKQIMYLKIEGNKVVGWESDFKRNSSNSGAIKK